MVYCVDVVDAREMIVTDFKYLTIVDTLLARINDQTYPGGRIPSTRELQAEFGASYGSVRSAILILKTMGVVEGKQGQGVFVVE